MTAPALLSRHRSTLSIFEDLDRQGTPISPDCLASVLRSCREADRFLARHRRFERRGYCRNRLHVGPGYEALLLCWLPGQVSPIHDHHGSACAFRVLEGTATETVFVPYGPRVRPAGMSVHPTGSVCAARDSDIHEVANWSEDPLVTLHLYSPRLSDVQTYERVPAAQGVNVA